MFEMANASTETLLSGLVSTCEETAAIASRLAGRAGQESMRTLLQERAASYRRAADELRGQGVTTAVEEDASALTLPDRDGELACIETVWEAIECSALIGFRDALDADLPADIHAAVRHWIEDGVSALERLRMSQTG
jgi:hypothetical protein